MKVIFYLVSPPDPTITFDRTPCVFGLAGQNDFDALTRCDGHVYYDPQHPLLRGEAGGHGAGKG